MEKNPCPIEVVLISPSLAKKLYIGIERDDRGPTPEESIKGDLAVGLQLFDYFLGKCKKGECPDPSDLNDELLEILSHLSISKCIEMKAYHIWDDKGKPTETDPSGLEDYRTALNEILNFCGTSSCPQKMTPACGDSLNRIKGFYNRKYKWEWMDKKGYWCFMANPYGNTDTHYHSAKGYIDDLYRFLEGEKPSNLREFVEKNISVMSVLAFLYLYCYTR